MVALLRVRAAILDQLEGEDARVLNRLVALELAEPDEFTPLARAARRAWEWRLSVRRELLDHLVVVTLPRGREVQRKIDSVRATLTTALANLDEPWAGEAVAARREATALRLDADRHMAWERRRVIRPVIRRMTVADRRHLAVSLASRSDAPSIDSPTVSGGDDQGA